MGKKLEIDGQQVFDLRLNGEEVVKIINLLTNQPYSSVADTIESIVSQVESQKENKE